MLVSPRVISSLFWEGRFTTTWWYSLPIRKLEMFYRFPAGRSWTLRPCWMTWTTNLWPENSIWILAIWEWWSTITKDAERLVCDSCAFEPPGLEKTKGNPRPQCRLCSENCGYIVKSPSNNAANIDESWNLAVPHWQPNVELLSLVPHCLAGHFLTRSRVLSFGDFSAALLVTGTVASQRQHHSHWELNPHQLPTCPQGICSCRGAPLSSSVSHKFWRAQRQLHDFWTAIFTGAQAVRESENQPCTAVWNWHFLGYSAVLFRSICSILSLAGMTKKVGTQGYCHPKMDAVDSQHHNLGYLAWITGNVWRCQFSAWFLSPESRLLR